MSFIATCHSSAFSARTKYPSLSTLVEQLLQSDLAGLIRSKSHRQQIWLVGGALRDHFLEIAQPDLDFAVDGDAVVLARDLADALSVPYYVLDEQRDTARVILPEQKTLDFARLRAPTLEEDLRLRDFSMNAMAVDLDDPDHLVDPLGGLQDLKDKVLRACATDSISRDAIRSLRAIRFSATLTLKLENQTKEQIRQSAAILTDCAAERRRDELSRMLEPDWVATAMRLLRRLELLPSVLPHQAALTSDAWDRTLSVVDRLAELMGAVVGGFEPERLGNLPLAVLSLKLGRYRTSLGDHLGATVSGGHRSSQILFLAALHSEADDAEGSAYISARSLRYSESEAVLARSIARCGFRANDIEDDISDLAAHRYFRDCGSPGIEAALLYLAISFAQSPTQDEWEVKVSVVRKIFEVWFEKHGEIVNPEKLLRGNDLSSALNLSPGPIIGELLAAIAEEQVEGRVSSKDEALEFARDRLLSLG
jgi:tRNA nucleotidyltransferase/poly(A) polymerase